MHLALRDGHFFNLTLLNINVSNNYRNNGRVNMWCLQVIYVPDYGVLLAFNYIFHYVSVVIIYLIEHFF